MEQVGKGHGPAGHFQHLAALVFLGMAATLKTKPKSTTKGPSIHSVPEPLTCIPSWLLQATALLLPWVLGNVEAAFLLTLTYLVHALCLAPSAPTEMEFTNLQGLLEEFSLPSLSRKGLSGLPMRGASVCVSASII